jgi:hypothetical protein
LDTIESLDRLVLSLSKAGRPARRRDVVGLVTLYGQLASSEELADSILAYRVAKLGHPERPVMLLLPAPISLRIDGLVSEVCELGSRVFRRDLIGALIWDRANDPGTLDRDFDTYLRTPVRNVEFDAEPHGAVLKVRRPSAGPRRMARY